MSCNNACYFQTAQGDVTLRSVDNVDFRVYKCILAEASPFFKDLFTLPQPPSQEMDTPVIDVSEDAEVLNVMLGLIYPGTDPKLETLDSISQALAVAMKYEAVRAIETLRRLLVSPPLLEAEPLRIYAIACRFDLEEEARIASRHTLRLNILDSDLSDDLKYITAYSYHRLLNLHRRRAQAALKELKLEDDVKCMQCSASHYGAISPPRWWTDFERRAREELSVRPTSDIVFSMEFLAQSSNTGCQRCPGSILDSYAFLQRVKQKIDDLPSTI
ncbi:hypothetical protein SCHPADRAFT_309748 [Schizopora paradoxa]|uniref:BTB domain-containing protein n=1 Tax=Schizopora paradoxa TaxID=27342 RepID=A0A0H2RRE8_9AGAM|nr:hypothetical protein SCHPADRAFT_309748 [Schizopora paradoxa]